MKAMILAAGKGTRVRPLTYEIPKPMIPLMGKPLMAYLVEHLARHEVREIMVNVAHLHERIEGYFGDGAQYGVSIGYSFEGYCKDNGDIVPQPLGSAGGMRKIQDFGGFFDETTIVICGDAVIDLDLAAVLAQHRAQGALATVVTTPVAWDKVSSYGIVVNDETGRVTSFQEKPERAAACSNQASTGIYLFEPEVLDLIPSGVEFDIGSQLFPLLVEKGLPFYAQAHRFDWVDIGTVSDYWSVMQAIMAGKLAGMAIPGRALAGGVHCGLNVRIDWTDTVIEGPVYIGSGTSIEAGVHIVGPCWIGSGCRVLAGAKITRSIVFDYTRIAGDADLHELVVFREYKVDRSGEIAHAAESPGQWGNARDRRRQGRNKPRVLAVAA